MMQRILPTAWLLAAMLLTLAAHMFVPLLVLVRFPWTLAGLLPLGAGIALNLAADRQFKRFDTTVKPFEPSTALIAEGVFRWSRNPMYLGFVLMVAGIAILMGSLTPWLVVAAFAILLRQAFILPEERKLEQAFGPEYERYMRRVRRWL